MIEFSLWLASSFLASLAHFMLFLKYCVNPHKLAVPYKNAVFTRRLALTNAITYSIFGILGIILVIFYFPQLTVMLNIVSFWWIVEILLTSWNIRTAFLIFMNIRSLRVTI